MGTDLHAPKSAARLPPIDGAGVEVCAGVGAMSRAFAWHGLEPRLFFETDERKARSLGREFPSAEVCADALTAIPARPVKLIAAYGGIPCQPTARPGKGLGLDDYRAPVTVGALPRAATLGSGEVLTVDAECSDQMTVVQDGAMIKAIDERFEALGKVRTPREFELLSPAESGGGVRRRRWYGHYELRDMVLRLGDAQRLMPQRFPRLHIRHLMLPITMVPAENFAAGQLQLIDHVISGLMPTTAAKLWYGYPGDPLIPGSRVRPRPGCEVAGGGPPLAAIVYVVTQLYGAYATLIVDSRTDWQTLPHVHQSRFEQILWSQDVLSIDSVAASFTRVGVPQPGPAKQLWLRMTDDGWRAVIPTSLELNRALEHADFTRRFHTPEYSNDEELSSVAGDGVSSRDAEAVAARSCTRIRLYHTQLAIEASEYSGPERELAKSFAQYPCSPPLAYLVVLAFRDNRLCALVGAELMSLPALAVPSREGGGKTRRSAAMAAAESMMACSFTATTAGFLCHDGMDSLIVAAAVSYDVTADASSFAVWVTLSELAASPLYAPVSFAIAHAGAWMHGCTHYLPDAVRGARTARPFFTSRYQPELRLDAWPKQLAYVECVDNALRRLLLARSTVKREDRYLREWAPAPNPAPHTKMPLGLRGASLSAFDDPTLVDEPFAFVNGIPKTKPPPSPKRRKPPAGFRPRRVPDLMRPDAIRDTLRGVKAIVDDLDSLARDHENFVRKAKLVIIKNHDAFWPDAQDIPWDLRHPQYDSDGAYFVPVDFDEPLGSHVSDDLFDQLGEEYDDQQIRYMMHGGMIFATNPDMDIVICPHLLSLANGFERVGRELSRLHAAGYLEFVEPHEAHVVRDPDSGHDVILALGYLPFRAAPQGTVERKLSPGKPRRVEDGGAPHPKPGSPLPARSLNDMIRARDCPSIEPEIKPVPAHQMRDNAALQCGARVWGEPVLGWCDDMSDMFNQLFTHVAQRFLTTILWRGQDGRMLHILERSLGFGVTCNSNYAQRFAYALVWLVMRTFDIEEERLFAAETDVSKRAWIAKRRAVSKRTGRNECRLYSVHIFTDDPVFQVVGLDRCIRLMVCWFRITRRLNLRMAAPEKRLGGTNGTWLGYHNFYTLGAAVITPNKRERALVGLSDLAERKRPTCTDYSSLVGLLEHLLPLTGMDRSLMHFLHAPKKYVKDQASLITITDNVVSQAKRWIAILATRSGVSTMCVLVVAMSIAAGTVVTEISSDAAKGGTDNPGLGGHCHGYTWRIALRDEDISGPFEIAIAVLEFAALIVNLIVFARRLVLGRRLVVVLTDSSTTADALVGARARAELMQLCYAELERNSTLQPLRDRLFVQHGYGDGNVISDASSRGYDDVAAAVCTNLRVRHEIVDVPPEAVDFVQRLREHHRGIVLERAAQAVIEQASADTPVVIDHEVDDPFGNGKRIGEQSHPGPSREGSPAPRPMFTSASEPRSSSPLPFVDFAQQDRVRGAAPQPSALPPHSLLPSRGGGLSPQLGSSAARSASPGEMRVFYPVERPGASAERPQIGGLLDFTTLPDDSDVSRPVPEPRAKAPAVIRHAERHFSASAGAPQMLDALRRDTSEFALRPDDPAELERAVRRVCNQADAGVPNSGSKKDAGYWKAWESHCAKYNTPAWRRDHAANRGDNPDGHAREIFLLADFVLDYFSKMKPRRKDRAQADPQGAYKAAQAIRRVHAGRGYALPSSPLITRVLRGLLLDYVKEHGCAALAPMRKEPITNAQTATMLSVPNGTVLGRGIKVDWASDKFIAFAALLTALRHCGARKADHLPVTHAEFDGRHMSRANLKWRLRDILYADPPHELLRSLRPGDCAIVTPATCKNDFTGVIFSDRPMHLPFVAGDPCNAAARYAELELSMPVSGTQRKRTPLYTTDGVHSLDHKSADFIFHELAVRGLGAEVAATLSLHSGRVWLACALLAQKRSHAEIQALCRWRSDASVKIYAHMQPEQYAEMLLSAMGAEVDASLTRSLPTLDHDARYAALQRTVDQLTARVARAASPSVPDGAARSKTPVAESSDDEDGVEADAEDTFETCQPDGSLPSDLVVVGQRVAVPFCIDGAEVMCPGSISQIKEGRVNVKFEDGVYQVARSRLFRIAV